MNLALDEVVDREFTQVTFYCRFLISFEHNPSSASLLIDAVAADGALLNELVYHGTVSGD
jgi:hypothetical protein